MEDAAARFRRELEERTGENVVAVAAAGIDPDGGTRLLTRGVLVLTESSLPFSRQHSVPWLSSM